MGSKKKATRKWKRQRARSSITGKFVTLCHAKRHPRTTVIESYDSKTHAR